MDIAALHRWDLDYGAARRLQEELSGWLKLDEKPNRVIHIAGCDVSGEWRGKRFHAAVVVLKYPCFEVLETVTAEGVIEFPYIPGLLSFREMPVLLKAWEKVKIIPDLVFCDGSGLIHPRRMGLACHLGLWLDIPVIGAAKNLLCGEYGDLGIDKGEYAPVADTIGIMGAAVRSKRGVKPIFISPGNRIDITSAIGWTLKCCGKYRFPEPIRAAHTAANAARVKG